MLITGSENAVALERQWKELVPSPLGITVSNGRRLTLKEKQIYDYLILE